MKKQIFTDEQIVGILHGFESSGLTIKEYGQLTTMRFKHSTINRIIKPLYCFIGLGQVKFNYLKTARLRLD